jgi:hypothetical protein
MKKKSKKLFCAIVILALVSVFVMQISAATSRDSGFFSDGVSANAYLNVHSSTYNMYGETTRSACSDSIYIYVAVTFNEYNPKLSETYYKYNEGANYTTAWVTGQGYNPDTVDGIHVVYRELNYWIGDTFVDFT